MLTIQYPFAHHKNQNWKTLKKLRDGLALKMHRKFTAHKIARKKASLIFYCCAILNFKYFTFTKLNFYLNSGSSDQRASILLIRSTVRPQKTEMWNIETWIFWKSLLIYRYYIFRVHLDPNFRESGLLQHIIFYIVKE